MAVRWRGAVCFVGRMWLKAFKGALWMTFISVLVSSVNLSSSQFFSGSGSGMLPEENITCPLNLSCVDLPRQCLDCDFNTSCTYGEETSVTCLPIETAECSGEQNFTVTFNCSFCYQLPEQDYCCAPNDSCSVRGSPNSLYIADCSALETVTCIPPHQFKKQLRCNYSTGKRWTTAFLLSFTLGGFGVDRFYLEHWASACGKLISFGGLGVWSILDIILVGTGYLGPADGSAYIY